VTSHIVKPRRAQPPIGSRDPGGGAPAQQSNTDASGQGRRRKKLVADALHRYFTPADLAAIPSTRTDVARCCPEASEADTEAVAAGDKAVRARLFFAALWRGQRVCDDCERFADSHWFKFAGLYLCTNCAERLLGRLVLVYMRGRDQARIRLASFERFSIALPERCPYPNGSAEKREYDRGWNDATDDDLSTLTSGR
jgi:hypothetical protein